MSGQEEVVGEMPWSADGPVPRPVDRRRFVALLNQHLVVDPARTAVVTIDCHRGHLDPEVATMPVAPEAAAGVVARVRRLLEFARGRGLPVIHVILQNRVLPDGTPEPMRNPFWRAVEEVGQMLTPERESTISRHNLAGSVQTELMPELGPAPTDIVITTKRRLSIFRETDLDLTLRELGVDTLVLVGINTNTCVQCAAFEALNRDLRVIVLADGVHSMYGDDLHVFALQNIARCLGWVLTVDQLIEKVESSRVREAARA
jgi:nicotinamidase-related amidase